MRKINTSLQDTAQHSICLAQHFFFPKSVYICVFLLLKSHFFCNSSTLIRAELKKACSFRIPVPAFLLEGICFTYSESETFSKNTMHVLIPLIKIPPHFQNCCQLLAFVCISQFATTDTAGELLPLSTLLLQHFTQT